MTAGLDLVVLVAVALVAFVGFLACVHIVRVERARISDRFTGSVASRIGRHGIWTGAWLVTIPAERARDVRAEAEARCKREAPPEEILELWQRHGGRLFAHVNGPEVATEVEACGWVERASDDLAREPVPGLLDGGGRAPFALVYASTTPPPARPDGMAELRAGLGASCVAVAFVACRAREPERPGVPITALAWARWVFLGAAVAGLAGGVTLWIMELRQQTEAGASVVTASAPPITPPTAHPPPVPVAEEPPAPTTAKSAPKTNQKKGPPGRHDPGAPLPVGPPVVPPGVLPPQLGQ